LGRGVGGQAGDAAVRADVGGDVHDGAAAVLFHVRDLVLHGVEDAGHVGAEQGGPVGGVDVGERAARTQHPGVVDGDVEAAVPVGDGGHHAGAVAGAGDVGGHPVGADLLGRVGEPA